MSLPRDYACTAPVAILAFNRPETTEQVLRAVARARPARLLICADGPRPDRPEDVARCAATRALVERVDWPCRISTRFLAHNEGIGRAISGALDWVFSQSDEAIILEDDCVPTPSFFPFCEEMLARYRDDERIGIVRGCAFPGRAGDAHSYRYSRYHNIWGWAGWSRNWKHFDYSMRAWPEFRASRYLETHMRAKGIALILKALLNSAHDGRQKTWDLRWWLALWRRDVLSIAPNRNLITNIGFGPGATHTTREGIATARLDAEELDWPLVHPPRIEVDDAADQVEWAYMRSLCIRPPQPIALSAG